MTLYLSPQLMQSSSHCSKQASLLVILLLIVTNNIVEPKLIHALAGADNTEPVTELLLLQKLLGQVLEVAARELLVRDNLDLAVLEVGDADRLAEVSGAAVDLDARLQEGGEGRGVEDLVVGGLASVDDVLKRLSSQLLYSSTAVLSAKRWS